MNKPDKMRRSSVMNNVDGIDFADLVIDRKNSYQLMSSPYSKYAFADQSGMKPSLKGITMYRQPSMELGSALRGTPY